MQQNLHQKKKKELQFWLRKATEAATSAAHAGPMVDNKVNMVTSAKTLSRVTTVCSKFHTIT